MVDRPDATLKVALRLRVRRAEDPQQIHVEVEIIWTLISEGKRLLVKSLTPNANQITSPKRKIETDTGDLLSDKNVRNPVTCIYYQGSKYPLLDH